MTKTNDFYAREFFSGSTTISRSELESLPCPFCTDKVTDQQMQAIIERTCQQVKIRMGLSDSEAIDLSDDKMDEIWWEELERTVVASGVPYCEDMNE